MIGGRLVGLYLWFVAGVGGLGASLLTRSQGKDINKPHVGDFKPRPIYTSTPSVSRFNQTEREATTGGRQRLPCALSTLNHRNGGVSSQPGSWVDFNP